MGPELKDEEGEDIPGPSTGSDNGNGGRRRKRGHDDDQQKAADLQDRRQRMKDSMAEVARRRAAHFATFDTGGGDEGGNRENDVHIGGEHARSLGPWSTAVQLADARSEAKAKREEKIMNASRDGKKTGSYAYEGWKPSRDLGSGPRHRDSVEKLKDVSLGLVTRLIGYVESLWGIPDDVRSQIATEVCKRRCMTPDVFKLFTKHVNLWLSVPDCSEIEEDVLLEGLLQALESSSLETLHMGLCGRGMTDAVAKSLTEEACLSRLGHIVLGGAYRLTDAGCLMLLEKARELQIFGIPKCSRIEGKVIEMLPEVAPKIHTLDISWCCGIPRNCLSAACKRLDQLESISLDGIIDFNDDLVMSGALDGLKELKRLSVAHCTGLSDVGLESISSHHPRLDTIVLDHCGITSSGVIQMGTNCPNLVSVSLKRCALVHDDAIAHLVQHCEIQKLNLNGVKRVTGAAIDALVTYRKTSLNSLDVSWCRLISEEALGYLCDSCTFLETLYVWGCSHVSNNFLFGHSNKGLNIVGRGDEIDGDVCIA